MDAVQEQELTKRLALASGVPVRDGDELLFGVNEKGPKNVPQAWHIANITSGRFACYYCGPGYHPGHRFVLSLVGVTDRDEALLALCKHLWILPDGKRDPLGELLNCANSWVPEARLLGNVSAKEIQELCEELVRYRAKGSSE